MKIYLCFALASIALARGNEFHVAVDGNDAGDATASHPLRTINAAAQRAEPGDVITVHAGTYRERVTPPRGGLSDSQRITYQAAPGEAVTIKGSEVVRGWKPITTRVWKATLPNSFFGKYNPYKDLINGDWFTDNGRPHHTGEVYLNGKSLWETHLIDRVLNPVAAPNVRDKEESTWTWFCESDAQNTYLYANFHDKDPNAELVEINVRESCFYPDQPGRNYITVRGFQLRQAATQWAAPTAEQIGLIGTHWSKGWIIENNVISDSKCSGVTLGKDRATGHNVWSKDPSKDGAIHYTEVVDRALAAGWSRDQIGSHIVRYNTISDCEQTGICGSLGAVFSEISSNHIYHIWAKRQFTGAEMAGIKLHAAIDVVIRNNRIHSAGRGMWMDWMAQGTRITRNLCYDNSTDDLFVEVDHGPFLVDNNIFLSPISVSNMSEGGAYVHNLFFGRIHAFPELSRFTPYHPAHSTRVAGLSNVKGGDDRFYNNIFIPLANRTAAVGLADYDTREIPLQTGGNVYFDVARPYARETNGLVMASVLPKMELREEGSTVMFQLSVPNGITAAPTVLVTCELLGKARVSGVPYEQPDGSSLRVDYDYFGRPRNRSHPLPGPFEELASEPLRVW